MRIQSHIAGGKADDRLGGRLGADLESMNKLRPLACANIVLEWQREISPAFEAVALIGVAGPDRYAAARDHTWLAAWHKANRCLRERTKGRKSCQIIRRQSEQ
jgi:hypothetical protein